MCVVVWLFYLKFNVINCFFCNFFKDGNNNYCMKYEYEEKLSFVFEEFFNFDFFFYVMFYIGDWRVLINLIEDKGYLVWGFILWVI